MNTITEDLTQLTQLLIDRKLETVFTALTAKVIAYYPKEHAVDLKIVTTTDYPVLPKVPVYALGSAKWLIEAPLFEGDQGLVVFTKDSPELWQTSGGIQIGLPNKDFGLSNGFFLPGIRNRQGMIDNPRAEGISIRNRGDTVALDLTDAGCTIKGPVTIADSNINITSGDVIFSNTAYKSHVHAYESPTGPSITGIAQ